METTKKAMAEDLDKKGLKGELARIGFGCAMAFGFLRDKLAKDDREGW